MWGHREKITVCKPGREAAEETHAAHTLISDFQNDEKIHFCCLSGRFVVLCGLLTLFQVGSRRPRRNCALIALLQVGSPRPRRNCVLGGEIGDDQWMLCHQGSSQVRARNLPPSQFLLHTSLTATPYTHTHTHTHTMCLKNKNNNQDSLKSSI